MAVRLGTALRDARQAAALSQIDVAQRAGLSQPFISYLERGHGTSASIETWSCVAAAVGEQYVGFLEHASGAGRPRDLEHLRRQSALVALARAGGWAALPELAIDTGMARPRSIDVALVRRARGEAVAVEIWNWFDDVGAGMRGLDAKTTALAARLAAEPPPPTGAWSVRGLYVVRDTRRNRALVGEVRPLFAARFPGSAVGWLAALNDPDCPVPEGAGLLWSGTGAALRVSRLGRAG